MPYHLDYTVISKQLYPQNNGLKPRENISSVGLRRKYSDSLNRNEEFVQGYRQFLMADCIVPVSTAPLQFVETGTVVS